MLASTWSVVRLVVGTVLMLIGLLGTIVPIIPGLPVFLAGLAVAGSSHPVTKFVRKRWEMWRAWSHPEAPPDRRRSLRHLLANRWKRGRTRRDRAPGADGAQGQ